MFNKMFTDIWASLESACLSNIYEGWICEANFDIRGMVNLFLLFFPFFLEGGGGVIHSEIAVRFTPYKTRTHGFYLCQ